MGAACCCLGHRSSWRGRQKQHRICYSWGVNLLKSFEPKACVRKGCGKQNSKYFFHLSKGLSSQLEVGYKVSGGTCLLIHWHKNGQHFMEVWQMQDIALITEVFFGRTKTKMLVNSCKRYRPGLGGSTGFLPPTLQLWKFRLNNTRHLLFPKKIYQSSYQLSNFFRGKVVWFWSVTSI